MAACDLVRAQGAAGSLELPQAAIFRRPKIAACEARLAVEAGYQRILGIHGLRQFFAEQG